MSAENEWWWRYNFLIFCKSYSIASKRVVIDSKTINDSVDIDEKPNENMVKTIQHDSVN